MIDTTGAHADRSGPPPDAGAGRVHRRLWPALFLLVVSPVVAEFQFGSSPLTMVGELVLFLGAYGAPALLIREFARRSGRGWPAMVLLGATFAIVEEGMAEPTWLVPHLFAHPLGVIAGVNTVYAAFNVGLHALWSITLPILLTETVFPAQRHRAWLPAPAIVVCAVGYVLAVVAAGIIFFRVAGPSVYHVQIPFRPVAFTVCAVLGLVLAAVAVRVVRAPAPTDRTPPPPWAVLVLAFAAAAAWMGLLHASNSANVLPGWAGAPALLAEVLVAVLVVVAAVRWTSARAWSDAHRAAAVLGAVLPHLAQAYLAHWLHGADLGLKIGLDALTVVLLVALLVARSRRPAAVPARR